MKEKKKASKISRFNVDSLKRIAVETVRYLFFILFLAALGGLVYLARHLKEI